MSTLWTFPGKIGDCFLQWPVARRWADQKRCDFGVAVSEALKPLVPLLAQQPNVKEVQVWEGISNFTCGGQPWDFGGDHGHEGYNEVIHAGFRKMPTYQITQFTRDSLGLQISSLDLGRQSIFVGPRYPERTCVIHGTLSTHKGELPRVWPLVRAIRYELEELFGERIYLVGTGVERKYAQQWIEGYDMDDGGNWSTLAHILNHAEVVIAAGSSVAALAGSMAIPCARVHDEVNGLPAHVWSSLGPDQLNLTEFKPELLLQFVKEIHDKSGSTDRPPDHREPENLAFTGLGPSDGRDAG